MKATISFFLAFCTAFMPAAFAQTNPPIIWGGGKAQLLQDGLVTNAGNNVDAPNYIRNGDFAKANVLGWATYADAAGTTPVDGTGGSPNETFAASASSPLSGNWSAILTKDAANRQGQGVSYDFSIDNIDKSNVVCFSMSSELSSAGAPGDFVFYVYDVTNSTLIAPSITSIPSATYRDFNSCFVATTSTSYRAIIHTATTSTSAMTLKIDNVKISRQQVSYGTATTDEVAYTPTLSAFGTTTNVSGYWAQDANRLVGRVQFVTGTTIANPASISLPSNLVIDQAKLNGTEVVGEWWRDVPTGSSRKRGAILAVPSTSTTLLYFGNDDYTTAQDVRIALNGNSVSSTSATTISARFSVPIVGWSSNIQVANQGTVEYAFNTGTWDANDTTSFGYGPNGVAMGGTLTAARTKRIRFQTPIQPTDFLSIEINDNGQWVPSANLYGYIRQNTARSGIGFGLVTGTTDIDVTFLQYAELSGATFGAAGTNWSSSYRWRVGKYAKGAYGYMIDGANVFRDYRSIGTISATTVLTNLNTSVYYVTTTAPRTITLPAASTALIGYAVTIKDDSGSAAANNITVSPTGSDTIDGSASNVISSNWGARTYRVRSATSWRVE